MFSVVTAGSADEPERGTIVSDCVTTSEPQLLSASGHLRARSSNRRTRTACINMLQKLGMKVTEIARGDAGSGENLEAAIHVRWQ